MSELFTVLSIDGGGIRGIIPAQVLVGLEAILKEEFPDAPRIADHFDLVAGTSTGGILACGLLVPNDANSNDVENTNTSIDEGHAISEYTASDLLQMYFEKGGEIFDASLYHTLRSAGGWTDSKYRADTLERVLKEYFGDLLLSDLLRPCLLTSYDISRRKAHFFRQHTAQRKSSHDFYVRDAIRGTSAAPTFFEPAYVRSEADVPFPLIDGGLFANNPTACALAEAIGRRFKKKLDEIAILSLGTGSFKQPYDYQQAKDWGTAGWILPLVDMMMSGVGETTHYQIAQIFHGIGKEAHYLRLDATFTKNPLEPAPDLDDASEKNIRKLSSFGRELADSSEQQLRAFAQVLQQRRNSKSE